MGTVTERRAVSEPGPIPSYDHLVIVCAHPDDETFGLGGLLSAFAAAGTLSASSVSPARSAPPWARRRTSRSAAPVDRSGQYAAMVCHGSQLVDNPLLRRRIDLQGDRTD